jgi:hypothetical protein
MESWCDGARSTVIFPPNLSYVPANVTYLYPSCLSYVPLNVTYLYPLCLRFAIPYIR